MGPCWAHVRRLKPAISDIAACFGVCWGHAGPMLGLYGTMLGPCWAHVGHLKPAISDIAAFFWCMLGPCWAYMEPCWANVGHLKPAISDIPACFCVCWSHVGPIETSFII